MAERRIEVVHVGYVVRSRCRHVCACWRGCVARNRRRRGCHGEGEEETLVETSWLGLFCPRRAALFDAGLEFTDHVLQNAEGLLETEVASYLELAETCPEERDGLCELAALVALLAEDHDDGGVDCV